MLAGGLLDLGMSSRLRGRVSRNSGDFTSLIRKSVMRYVSLTSWCALLVLSLGVLHADDKKDNSKDSDKKHRCRGTVVKVDADKHTLTVKTMDAHDKDAKEQEKTFTVADDAKIMDSSGKEEKLSELKSGDSICLTEKDGKITKVREHAVAKITKVDQKAGTVTVKTKDKDGKDLEKTFRLVEDAEYIDSTGRIAVLDVFRSGDDILFIEADGRIEEMKKDDQKKNDKNSSNNK